MIDKNLKYLFYKYGNFDEWEKIGSGANGTTYLTTHKLLDKKVAIKIYKIDTNTNERKYYDEIIKNSNEKVIDFSPVVVDAGDFYYEENKYLYSIMPFLKDSITLKNFLQKMKGYTEEIRNSNYGFYKKLDIAYMDQLKLDILFKLVMIYSELLRNDIIHGDLHRENILIKDIFYKDEFGNTCMINIGQRKLGSLHIEDLNLNIIDFGTSNRIKSDKDRKEGIIRDYYHISILVAQLIKFQYDKIGNNKIINILKSELKENLLLDKKN